MYSVPDTDWSTVIERVFGVRPRVFIPPFNRINENTLPALESAGMTHLSSMFPIDAPPYRHGEEPVARVPAMSATGDYVEGVTGGWQRWATARTVEFMDDALARVGFAVRMWPWGEI